MWKDLTLKQKAEIMKMSVANGVTDINDIQSLYDNSIPNQFDDGGFVNFYNSLPRNQRDSTNYNVRRYWELNGKPKDFNEAVQRGMYTKQSDGWHANSVAYNEVKDEYEFMKSPTHPTTIYEIGAYLNNKDFQKEYYLDYTSKPNYKYRKKPSWMYNNGGHLYKNAGQLDKAKDQPKYQYGIIEQILRENGVNFRVTSGARKPNQAGNAGKSSAHTYTIFGDSPGAIDIVPGVGSDWNTLFAQMSSPKVRKALSAYGLDILNETNPSVMASTKATGPHLHVGRGIKGQQGLGQIFGGISYGGDRGDAYRLQYSSQRNSDYTPIYSQNAFEPIVIGGNNTSNPWLDYIRSVESIGNQGINPVFNTPIRPTNTGLNGIKSTFTPTDFSSLSNSSDVVSPLEPYAAKQNIEYGLGLEGNALWNSPYLMFDNHSAANGGHLFGTAGQMLIRDNAVNPALRYVYGDDYEEYIRQLRNYRPVNTERRVKPRYNLSQQTDVIGNTAKPVNKSIRNKQINSPQRQQREQKLANDRYWQNERERQGTISQARDIVRDPVYNREFANEVQALREREAEEAKKRYPVDLAMKQGLELMEAIPWPSTVAGSLFNPNTHWYEPGSFFSNLYANDNRGFFNYNQATRDFYDANPEIGGVVNLAGDFVVPGAAAKALKGASRVGKFATADIGNSWKTLRYELAHPEAQTLGIIPDRLNPFTDGTTRKLKSFRDKIWTPNKILNNRIERLNGLIENRVYMPVDDIVQTPYGDIPITIRFDKLDPKETPLSEIEVRLGDSKNLKGLPLEEGMTISSNGEKPLLGNTFAPDKAWYFPGGESTQILRVKNVKGDVEIPFERGTFGGTRPYDSPKTFSPYSKQSPTIVASRDNKMFSAYNEVPNFFVGVNQRVLAPQRPAILPEGHPIRRAAKGYVEDLEQRLVGKDGKPIASVEGSYRAVANGLPHSPNDVEFIVPEENLDAVRKVFNVRAEEPKSNGFGATISADEFDALPAGTADFEIIKNGPNGGAIGNTAWELYQYLHPEEASRLNMKYIREAGKDKKTIMAKSYRDAQELPISAKELFDEYMASGMYENKYMYDTLGAPRGKYASRRDDFGLAGDPDTYFKRLTEKIHSEFSGSKTLSEQGYNIDYTNVDANKAFLKYFELSEEYATNPKVMRNVVEEQMHAFQTVNRGTGISRPQSISEAKWVEKPVEERIQDIKNMNTQAKGGRGSGDGENATNQFNRGENSNTGVPNEVEVVRQIPLSIREETIKNIKTPEDLIKRIEEIEKLNVEHGQDLAKLNDLSTKQQTHDLAMEKDMPMVIGRDYGDAGQYIGNLLMGKDVGFDMRYVAGDKGFEITKPFQPQKVRKSSTWKMDETAARQLLQDTFDTVKKSNTYNSTVNRGIKLRNMRDKLWARQEIQQKTKVLGIAGLGTVTVGGLPHVLYENFVNTPTSIKEETEYEKETLSKIENGDYRTLAYYLGKNPYDFKKLSNSEKETLKRQALKELKQDIEGLEEQYNDKVK